MEVNTAGHLEFTMSAYHPYYNTIKPLKSTIEVYEDDKLIWFGRPVDIHIDFYKQKKVYCEGALSFFNDTIQRPNTYEDFSLHSFFSDLIELHNMEVSTASRRFKVGNITVDDKTVYRELKYESTYDAIQHMCLDTDGGYLFFRREGNKNYIDWLKEMPYTCNQPIQFALNLLDYGSEFDGSDLATCLIPLGSDDLTIETVNGGSDVLVTEAANEYGEITKVQRYSDITDASELKREGQRFLEDSQFNSSTIECSAADLHSINGEYEQFILGQMVHCISDPHLVDKYFPLSKMSIKLDSAAKEITLGTIKRKTLTRIYKQQTDTTDQDYGYDDYGYGYDPSVFTDDNGDPWVLVPPENDGDPVSAVKLPTHITVAKPPNKTTYKSGEKLNYSGIVVNIWCGDKLWTGDGHSAYKDGHAPLRELSFSGKTAPVMKEGETTFQVMVFWSYKGKRYSTKLDLNVGTVSDWTCNSNYLVGAAGTYIGSIGGRDFYKRNDGKAIAFYKWNDAGWYGPCLVSTDRNAVLTNWGNAIIEFDYGGLHWFWQTGWHYQSPNGAKVVTPRLEGSITPERIMQQSGVVIS